MNKASFYSMKLEYILEELRGIPYFGLFSKEMYTLSKSLNSYVYFETRKSALNKDFTSSARIQNSLKMDELLSFVLKKSLKLRRIIKRKEKTMQKKALLKRIKRLLHIFLRIVSKKIEENKEATFTLIPNNRENLNKFASFPRIFGSNLENLRGTRNEGFPSVFFYEKAVNTGM